jgi:hypothetical protein
LAGRLASIAREAASLQPGAAPPTVVIESADRLLIVREYESVTLALKCERT